MTTDCLACKEYRVLTKEHIIPQAIGGKLTAVLYCDMCNSTFGRKLDVEISKQYGEIGTLLRIKRERGAPQPFEVEDIKSGTTLISDGQSLKRKTPIVKIESRDGKKLDYADVTARSEKELHEIMSSIKKRYNVSGEAKIFQEVHPGPTDIRHDIIIDNSLLRRAVSKIAYGFLCTKLSKDTMLSSPFDAIREYLNTGNWDALAHANFIHTQFMVDYIRPLHKIHIALNKSKNLIVGYVSLFGIFRFTVLLAEGFESELEWPGLDYTFDPVHGQEVVGNDNFRAPELTKENILNPAQSKEFVQEELKKGFKLLDNYNDNYEFQDGEL